MNSTEAIKEQFSNLELLINEYKENEQNIQELWSSISNLTEKMDIPLKPEESFNGIVKNVPETSTSAKTLVKLFDDLQEKFTELESHYSVLNNDNSKFQEMLESNDNKDVAINSSNILKNSQQLMNKFYTAQSVAAEQFDEMELQLKTQLSQANQKLVKANNSCGALISELLQFKNCVGSNTNVINNGFQELEVKVRKTVQGLQSTQKKLNDSISNHHAVESCSSENSNSDRKKSETLINLVNFN